MELQEFMSFLTTLLRDEVIGTVSIEGKEVTVTFTNGTVRKVIVK